uniref:Uncharacterized protein n=1 Tax=Arundo donax TaxID=35708 RepID=A0A0A8ZMC4_ARUDO
MKSQGSIKFIKSTTVCSKRHTNDQSRDHCVTVTTIPHRMWITLLCPYSLLLLTVQTHLTFGPRCINQIQNSRTSKEICSSAI